MDNLKALAMDEERKHYTTWVKSKKISKNL